MIAYLCFLGAAFFSGMIVGLEYSKRGLKERVRKLCDEEAARLFSELMKDKQSKPEEILRDLKND